MRSKSIRRRHRALRALAAGHREVEADLVPAESMFPATCVELALDAAVFASASTWAGRLRGFAVRRAPPPQPARSTRQRRERGARRASWRRVFQIRSPEDGDAGLRAPRRSRGRGSRSRARHLRAPLRRATRASLASRGAGRRGCVDPGRREPARAAGLARRRHARRPVPRQARPGMHHVAYEVDDIRAALAHLSDAGAELIDEIRGAACSASRSPSSTLTPSTVCSRK